MSIKGRITSFRRFGSVFGLSSCVQNKYLRGKTKRTKIYEGTTSDDSKPTDLDCYDNYGCFSEGILKLDSQDRKTADSIKQFDPKNATPKAWQDKNKKTKVDCAAIYQENLPLAVQGNFEYQYLEDNDIKNVKNGIGFAPSHASRPLKYSSTYKKDPPNSNTFVFEIPNDNAFRILNLCEKIEINASANYTRKAETTQLNGGTTDGKLTTKYAFREQDCAPCGTIKDKKEDVRCINKNPAISELKISGNIKATLKRHCAKGDFTKDESLDISPNIFTEKAFFMATQVAECDLQNNDEAILLAKYNNSKVFLFGMAKEKTKYDAGCIPTTSISKYMGSKISKKEFFNGYVEKNVFPSDCFGYECPQCAEGGAYVSGGVKTFFGNSSLPQQAVQPFFWTSNNNVYETFYESGMDGGFFTDPSNENKITGLANQIGGPSLGLRFIRGGNPIPLPSEAEANKWHDTIVDCGFGLTTPFGNYGYEENFYRLEKMAFDGWETHFKDGLDVTFTGCTLSHITDQRSLITISSRLFSTPSWPPPDDPEGFPPGCLGCGQSYLHCPPNRTEIDKRDLYQCKEFAPYLLDIIRICGNATKNGQDIQKARIEVFLNIGRYMWDDKFSPPIPRPFPLPEKGGNTDKIELTAFGTIKIDDTDVFLSEDFAKACKLPNNTFYIFETKKVGALTLNHDEWSTSIDLYSNIRNKITGTANAYVVGAGSGSFISGSHLQACSGGERNWCKQCDPGTDDNYVNIGTDPFNAPFSKPTLCWHNPCSGGYIVDSKEPPSPECHCEPCDRFNFTEEGQFQCYQSYPCCGGGPSTDIDPNNDRPGDHGPPPICCPLGTEYKNGKCVDAKCPPLNNSESVKLGCYDADYKTETKMNLQIDITFKDFTSL